MTWTDHQFKSGLTWDLSPPPSFKEHDHISNTNILQWRITSFFFKRRNPTRINLIWSNFQYILQFLFKFSICRYEKPKQIQFALPLAFYNFLHTLSQTFPVSALLLRPSRHFSFRQLLFPFPSLHYSSLLPSLAFQTTQKFSPKSFLWFLSVV